MAAPSRTPAEAVEHYRARTVRLLSSVTSAHTTVSGYHAADRPHRLLLADGDTVRLRAEQRLMLRVVKEYRLSQDSDGWRVRVLGYLYGIEYEGQELVAYHWHPHGASRVTAPHLHVGGDVRVGDRWLGKAHLPTGTVGLDQILALAIVELGVEPVRDDWERMIDEAADR